MEPTLLYRRYISKNIMEDRNMKKTGFIIASLALGAVLAVSGCAQQAVPPVAPTEAPAGTPTAPVETPGTALPNPVVEVESAADFEALGVKIDAPEGATDVSYRIIGDKLAEITFTLDGVTYTYRSANTGTEEDISGVYTEFEERSDIAVDGADWYAIININTNKDAGALATWQYLPVQFSLYTKDKADTDAFTNLATDLAHAAFQANAQNSPAPVG